MMNQSSRVGCFESIMHAGSVRWMAAFSPISPTSFIVIPFRNFCVRRALASRMPPTDRTYTSPANFSENLRNILRIFTSLIILRCSIHEICLCTIVFNIMAGDLNKQFSTKFELANLNSFNGKEILMKRTDPCKAFFLVSGISSCHPTTT